MIRFVTAVTAVLATVMSGAAWAGKIGVASVVTNAVQGSSPQRSLAVGNDVFSAEKIRTGDASAAQLMFLDSTNVNIGARSELTLDRFVYNPARGAGNVVLSASKGTFRFITGSQNPTNYSIKTPVATIGVRGTIVDVRTGVVSGVNTTVITLVEGRVIVTTLSGQQLVLDKPGTSYVVKSNGLVQGPIAGSGLVANFLSEPKLYEPPDHRMDLIDVLGHGGGPGGSRSFRNCSFATANNC
jgi:hypothetical protein